MNTEYRTYRITMPGQFPGHRPRRLIRAKVVRETAKTIVLETAQGETIRRHKANVAEVQPQGHEAMLVQPLGYVAARPIPPSIGVRPDLPLAKRLEAYVHALRRMDWHYQMSDDHRVYQRGSAWLAELRQERKAIIEAYPDPSVEALVAWATRLGCGRESI